MGASKLGRWLLALFVTMSVTFGVQIPAIADDGVNLVVDDKTGAMAVEVDTDVADTTKEVAGELRSLGLDKSSANVAAKDVLKVPSLKAAGSGRIALDDDVPRQGDGSNIESLELWWVTPDTVDNHDAQLLYIKPQEDEDWIVRMRLNYALSGEHDYNPEDIRITVPDTMFANRDGNRSGIKLTIPYPEAPNKSQAFMWSHDIENGVYVLTNTRKLSAATKGFIEFAWSGLTPHKLVDMADSKAFQATIEVSTHKDNIIGLSSNELVARFDTEQVVDRSTKYAIGNPSWVTASSIPADKRIAGEEEYVLVNWYMYCNHYGNTEFMLQGVDQVMDEYNGFILDSSLTGRHDNKEYSLFNGWARAGEIGNLRVTVAYPGSQFEPDTTYVLKNRITYTLTEKDPECNGDPQKVTTTVANASVNFRWHLPVFEDPTGHFMLNKIGNDGANGRASAPYWSRSYRRADLYHDLDVRNYTREFHNTDDGYGIYPSALNDLRDGKDVEVAYTVESIGYMAPWQLDGDPRIEASYGRKPVSMVTYDTDETRDAQVYLAGNQVLNVGTDYDYKAVEFPIKPNIGKLVGKNINPDGSFVARHAGDGTFLYSSDSDVSKIPVITLEGKIGGSWKKLADIDWSSGACRVTTENGALVAPNNSNNRINLPAGVTQLRSTVTSTNAYLWYYFRPILMVHPSDEFTSTIETLFSVTNMPKLGIYNTASMYAYDSSHDLIVEFHKNAMDELRGYTTDIAVYPYKNGQTNLSDAYVDYVKREVRIHYTARVEEKSVITDRATYDLAVENGDIVPETAGVWYDLLPIGIRPDLNSIRLRNGDTIVSKRAIDNWRDSGRTMMIVETEMTPVPTRNNNEDPWMDVPRIEFDAKYNFDSIADYGTVAHNVIAFESKAKDEIGTVKDYSGEADDSHGTANVSTKLAFADEAECDLMDDLNEKSEKANFVYAGTTTVMDFLNAAQTSLSKDVRVNDSTVWGEGTYYGDPEHNKLTVYEGGHYSYRLRMMSNINTVSKQLILYDSFENFYAGDGNDEIDIDAPRWQGYFRSIDLTQLRELDIAPVVYYSTVDNLELSDETDPTKGNAINLNLDNANIWVKADDYDGNLDDIEAIAIDCRRKTDGSEFELDAEQAVSVEIHMQAPSGDDARLYISQKGVWGDSAHAYNNAYLTCESLQGTIAGGYVPGTGDAENFVRKDYTKIGLMEHNIPVKKVWDDDDDRDGYRPESVTFHLYADGEDTGLSKTCSADDGWECSFDHVPYTDPEGNKIIYTVREDVPAHYSARVASFGEGFVVTNTHDIDLRRGEGDKTWVDTPGENMPANIRVSVLADGVRVKSQVISPNDEGDWEYLFEDLPVYRDHGERIIYTVQEEGADPSFIVEYDGFNITNTWHPYGDLEIHKRLTNTTTDFMDKKFTLMLSFNDESGNPLSGDFEWESTSGATGTISSGGTLEIGNDETIRVKELPRGTRYSIEEADAPGYTLRADGLTGVIRPNEIVYANLENIYSATGGVTFKANKTLSGRDMTRYQFRFQLLSETGELLKTAANDAEGNVAFGAVGYTEADAGHTYTYRIVEVDRGKSGYTYDDSEYTATVAVVDNGDGTLSTNVTYKRGSETVAIPEFANEYHAEGSTTIKAWKVLDGGQDLGDGDFTFNLVDESGNVIQTATNDATGSIVFDPLEYDESDAGKKFKYAVVEVKGSDETVIYDDSVFGYAVTVVDNGDGTLTCSQGYLEATSGDDGITYGDTTVDPPVFHNRLQDGGLAITKRITDDTPEEHQNDEFTFHVQLTGENLPETITYELEPIGDSSGNNS